MSDQATFDEMEPAVQNDDEDADDVEPVAFSDYLDDGEAVVGVIERIQEDVGKYDSTLYTLRADDAGTLKFWGNGSVDAQVNEADVAAGDRMGVKRDGTYENKYGEFDNYEVRVARFDP